MGVCIQRGGGLHPEGFTSRRTGVCIQGKRSVHQGKGGLHPGGRGLHPRGVRQTSPLPNRILQDTVSTVSNSRQCASYWNAFLFFIFNGSFTLTETYRLVYGYGFQTTRLHCTMQNIFTLHRFGPRSLLPICVLDSNLSPSFYPSPSLTI